MNAQNLYFVVQQTTKNSIDNDYHSYMLKQNSRNTCVKSLLLFNFLSCSGLHVFRKEPVAFQRVSTII